MSVTVSCTGRSSCQVAARLTVHETRRGHKLIGMAAGRPARKKLKTTHRQVTIGRATTTLITRHKVKFTKPKPRKHHKG